MKPGYQKCRQLLTELTQLKTNPAKFIECILQNDYYASVLSKLTNSAERIEDIKHLANFSRNYESIETLINDLALLTDRPQTETAEIIGKGNKITLSTIHHAKGLEWQVVFLISCNEGIIPFWRALEDRNGEEEERRLFYVATTRAKNMLYYSVPNTYCGAPWTQRTPSRFLEELYRKNKNYFTTEECPILYDQT